MQEVCKEVQSLYPDVIAKPYQIDISDSSQVHHVFNRVRSDFDGQIDILVNNAAITFTKALMNNTEANIRRIFDVNTLANFWTIREVLPEMQERNAGHILTVASIAGFMGTPNMVDYW